ncbi:MAG: SpoIIE family protein phosphatase [Sphingobacteriaceae bacterium]|nr:SpoIIE family protein phosphatase [Sphingobacteriaceae bacterium]
MYRISLIFLIVFVACKQPQAPSASNNSKADSLSVKEVTFKSVETHKAVPNSVEVGKPVMINVGKGQAYPANANTTQVEDLTAFAAEVLPERKLGADTLKLPKTFSISLNSKLCMHSRPVHALPPRFKDAAISDIQYLDVDQGLVSSTLKCVMTDKTGNIWIGTNGSGVCRYDGRSFFNFDNRNGLSNDNILCMLEDSKGNLWFGTEGGGVCFFDGINMNTISEEEGLSNSTVLSLLEGKDGKIWIGTNGGGMYAYENNSLTVYTEEQGLPSSSIRALHCDQKGNIWIGTTGGGACYFNGTSFFILGEDEGLNSTIIHDIYEDKEGLIYFATDDGGVNIYDGKTVKYITKKRGLSSDCIISIHQDKTGNLWLGTYDAGLCMYDGHEIRIYNTEHGLTNNYILSIAEDNNGNLWLATKGGGICKFNNASFSHFTNKEGFGQNTVRAICEDKNGKLFFSTYGDGLITYDGNNFNHYGESDGLPSNRLKASVVEGDNLWLVPENNGLLKYNGKNFEWYTENSGLVSDYVLSLCQDKKGCLWIGTDESGICCMKDGKFISFPEEEGLSDAIVPAILEDKTGNIWIATEGSGLCKYDGENFTWYTKENGLNSNYIACLFQDSSGDLWVGTDGRGVNVIKGNTLDKANPDISKFTVNEGLSNNVVRSITQDMKGNYWISTEHGLNYIKKTNGPYKVHVYTTADGLKANDFYGAVHIDQKNIIWWGNGKALTNLNLNKFKEPEITPVIQLNNIEFEKSFVDFHALNDPEKINMDMHVGEKEKKNLRKIQFEKISDFYNYPKDMTIPYALSQIEFEFSAIDWSGPEKIMYQYILVGQDEDWSPVSSENKAFYNKITNGDYVFKVKAIGVSGKWSEEFSYSFKVLPPWYRHPIAYASYVLAFFVVVIGFNNIRTRQLKLQQQVLERTVEERTAEIVTQKELIEQKQIEILDSINYAKRIQSAMLASDHVFSKNLYSYFVYFQPKDIVSGDFYFASPIKDGKFVVVTADSTGHGVPGAMMSMLNISCLNEAINERELASPAAILNHARTRIISSLAEDGSDEGGKDGMDASVIVFDFKNMKMNIAMANNNVWLVRNVNGKPELIQYKSDRMPVGKHMKDHIPFTEQEIALQKGDQIYAFTDGYCDQFGGPKQKKFNYKRLKEELLLIDDLHCNEKKEHLHQLFQRWKGDLEQVDDVLIIGVKV